MKSALGQPIIVENRTGASGMLATGAVAKAQPDGYTLLPAHPAKLRSIISCSRSGCPTDP